jgi:PKD repeat protein
VHSISCVVLPARRVLASLVLTLAFVACDNDLDPVTGPQANPPTAGSEMIRSDAVGATNGQRGIPFGPAELWRGSTLTGDPGLFTASSNYTDAASIVRQIETARAGRHKLVLNMTGGGHQGYKTAGKFDLAKWKAVMDTYDSPAIKAAVLAGVADGTVIMNSVMDEPNVVDWGGVMTKPLLDEMALYVKRMFPTLPVAVSVRHDWRTHEHFRVVDAILTNYRWNKGEVTSYRDAALAVAKNDGIAIAFALNVLDGGILSYATKACPIPLTAGYGTYSPTCRMTAAQVKDWGRTLGVTGCALMMWKYNAQFMASPENRQAFKDIAATLADLPAKPCRRSSPGTPPANSRPTATFTEPRCVSGAACQFNDGSSDADGRIALRRWDFGNGATSTETNPSVTYATEGVYSVSLTVTDDAGDADVLTKSVTVTPAAKPTLTAGFTFARCARDIACSFTDISTSPAGAIVAWNWNFGDGTTATDANPAHTFTAAGSYSITLQVADAGGASGAVTQTVTIGAGPNLPPTAGFAVPSCAVSAPCRFADGSADADGTITSRSWNLGNGTISTEAAPSTVYATAGSYPVTLTVVDEAGDSNSVTQSVTVSPVPNRIPVAAFTAPKCTVGVACQFRDGSTDLDGTITTRQWQFGNGSNSTSKDPSASYAAARSYTVTLKVTDNNGSTASVTKTMSVAPAPPEVTPIGLTVSGSVNQSRQYVMATWSGIRGSSVDIYRNGKLLMTTSNDGRQSMIIPLQPVVGYTYKVCERGTPRCSPSVDLKPPSIQLNVTGWIKEPGLQAMRLVWTGAVGSMMDVYRDGARVTRTPNTGRYTNGLRRTGRATYIYKVCVAGTTVCSKPAAVTVP